MSEEYILPSYTRVRSGKNVGSIYCYSNVILSERILFGYFNRPGYGLSAAEHFFKYYATTLEDWANRLSNLFPPGSSTLLDLTDSEKFAEMCARIKVWASDENHRIRKAKMLANKEWKKNDKCYAEAMKIIEASI